MPKRAGYPTSLKGRQIRKTLRLTQFVKIALPCLVPERANFLFTPTSRWRTFVFFIILNNLLRGGQIPRPLLNSKNIKK